MIKKDFYNLYYDTEHLLNPKPTDYSEIINRLEKLECTLFYNIISSPTCRYEKGYSEGRISDHYKSMGSEDRFQNIFKEKILYANPKGYFVDKLQSTSPKNCDALKSVSFTFSDYKKLPRHFDARGSEFGICFFHDFLQNKGIRPVEYLNNSDKQRIKDLIFNSPHLIEIYSPKYDMRWEDEWRISSNLHFTANDIAFVIVPEEKYEFYIQWFMDNDDFQEVSIISSNTYTSYIDHLITHPQHGNNSWNQIEIGRAPDGNGFKIDAWEFNDLTKGQKDTFSLKYSRELNCFAKNTILSNYEFAYTSKFLKFTSLLNNNAINDTLFRNYKYIGENMSEPDDSERDLVISLFDDLFKMYPPLYDISDDNS